MIEITCDACGKKWTDPRTEWILGYDLQVETPSALQRSIRFLDRWDNRAAILSAPALMWSHLTKTNIFKVVVGYAVILAGASVAVFASIDWDPPYILSGWQCDRILCGLLP